jgi:hypothetical protein
MNARGFDVRARPPPGCDGQCKGLLWGREPARSRFDPARRLAQPVCFDRMPGAHARSKLDRTEANTAPARAAI